MVRRANLKICLLIPALLLVIVSIAEGKIIDVDDDGPADFNNIQSAINSAKDDDTIVVQEGLYEENINFLGKNITLTSTDPNDLDVIAETIIDGSLGGSVVTFAGTESPACVLSGFTITNGRGTGAGYSYGGGTYGNGTLATIQYNIISKNHALTDEGFARGGGLYGCDGTIQYNIISSNWTSGQYSSRGGGLYDCDGIIQNNTIFGNSAEYGSGLSHCNGTIINCIIRQNTAYQAAQLSFSSTPSYSCIQEWSSEGIGNISINPLFIDPNNRDYHLKSQGWRWDSERKRWDYDSVTSRCIDSGNPGSPLEDELLSVPDDPNNIWGKNIRIDMGAYGGTKEASMPPHDWALLADLTNDGIVNLKDFAAQAQYWMINKNKQPGDFNRNGIVDIDDLALLVKDYLKQTNWLSSWKILEDDTEDSYSCTGDFNAFYPCSNAVDEDWDTYALPTPGNISYVYENFTIPLGTIKANWTGKYGLTAPVSPGYPHNVTSYWNGSRWILFCGGETNSIVTKTCEIPSDALVGTVLQLETPVYQSTGEQLGTGDLRYYEGKVIWYIDSKEKEFLKNSTLVRRFAR